MSKKVVKVIISTEEAGQKLLAFLQRNLKNPSTGVPLPKSLLHRLVRSGQQITAIAVDCGFASLSYFGKVFRQKFGCTPAQFRSKWQDITNTGR